MSSLWSRRALLDTSAYFALVDLNEQRHPDAESIRHRLVGERWRLFTTNFILAETHALLLTRLGYPYAMRFLDELEQSLTTIVRVVAADERRAREILRQYDDKAFSLTDATSFAVMERLRIPYAFTFDRNFAQYGLTVLSAN
jgi:predicted nucleic acid-binding protein